MFTQVFLFTIGSMFAVSICALWGKMGGDATFGFFHPHLRKILHSFHHWMFGLSIITLCPLFIMLVPAVFIPINFILGLGFGLFIDDVIFHNCECYFQRKES